MRPTLRRRLRLSGTWPGTSIARAISASESGRPVLRISAGRHDRGRRALRIPVSYVDRAWEVTLLCQGRAGALTPARPHRFLGLPAIRAEPAAEKLDHAHGPLWASNAKVQPHGRLLGISSRALVRLRRPRLSNERVAFCSTSTTGALCSTTSRAEENRGLYVACASSRIVWATSAGMR